MSLAGRYLPAAAARLGGDWYDAFSLPDGRLGLAIGDVVGRGFHAAAIMGQLRSGLRAYALDGMSPGEVLERLNRLLRQLEPGRTATLVYLVLDPHGGGARGRRRRPSAAARARPTDGEPCYLELPGSVPLGAARHVRYDDAGVRAGAGLGARCSTRTAWWSAPASRSTPGSSGSRATVQRGDDDLEQLGDALVDVLLPEGTGDDDAALLVVRALPLSDTLVAQFPAEVESIPVMRRLLGRWLDEAGATAADDRGPDRSRAPRPPRTRSSTRTASRPASSSCARPPRTGRRRWWPSATSGAGARRAALTAAAGCC